MTFTSLLDNLVRHTTETSLGHFGPELLLCATILILLLSRLFSCDRLLPAYFTTLVGSVLALFVATFCQFQIPLEQSQPEVFFSGMLIYDKFTVFFRIFLLLFLILVTALTVMTQIPDDEDGPDFYTLLIGSVIGMMLMVSANNLLMLFIGVEMASVPSYALVGFLKGRKLSSEAAFKFVVYGAGTAGVMLYGISLIAGVSGTTQFPILAEHLHVLVHGEQSFGLSNPTLGAVMMGVLMLFVGIAFKLSLFPFHFWCPDVFEGAAAEVAGFLSVASKAAAFALLVRFTLAFIGTDPGELNRLYVHFGLGLGLIACLTATLGNLAAYFQTNIKRLLAYSTIAHAGYMLMAVSALAVVRGGGDGAIQNPSLEAAKCVEGLIYYLFVYLFMNLGAFAIVAFIRNEIFSEEIDDYRGLVTQSPTLAICMLICLVSLIGLPPMGGFLGKLFVFASVYKATAIHQWMWVVLAFGALNTVFSLYYYLRIVKIMFLEERTAADRPVPLGLFSAESGYCAILSLMVVALGCTPLIGVISNVALISSQQLIP